MYNFLGIYNAVHDILHQNLFRTYQHIAKLLPFLILFYIINTSYTEQHSAHAPIQSIQPLSLVLALTTYAFTLKCPIYKCIILLHLARSSFVERANAFFYVSFNFLHISHTPSHSVIHFIPNNPRFTYYTHIISFIHFILINLRLHVSITSNLRFMMIFTHFHPPLHSVHIPCIHTAIHACLSLLNPLPSRSSSPSI